MKELEIKLTGQQNPGEMFIKIDDKPVDFKKNEFGNLICRYQTENNIVNIKVYRMLDVGGFGWFITQLFFFLISIFGIFDIHRKERCLVVDFECAVALKENNKLTLRFETPKENSKVVVETELTKREISNKYYVDLSAKKKIKGLKITKILLTLAIIATVAVLLFIKL